VFTADQVKFNSSLVRDFSMTKIFFLIVGQVRPRDYANCCLNYGIYVIYFQSWTVGFKNFVGTLRAKNGLIRWAYFLQKYILILSLKKRIRFICQ